MEENLLNLTAMSTSKTKLRRSPTAIKCSNLSLSQAVAKQRQMHQEQSSQEEIHQYLFQFLLIKGGM